MLKVRTSIMNGTFDRHYPAAERWARRPFRQAARSTRTSRTVSCIPGGWFVSFGLIEAIRFDRSGNPIVIPDSGGGNAASGVAVALEPIPEPASLSIVSLAALTVTRLRCRRRIGAR